MKGTTMIANPQVADSPTIAAGARPLSYHNWIHLNPGDRIIVKRSGFAPEQGTVDEVSEDASYFWVRIDGQSRILIFHGDGSAIHKVLP
jgi:hypothetical protein